MVHNFSLHPIVVGRLTQQVFEAGHSQKRTINACILSVPLSRQQPQDSSSENGDTYNGKVFLSQCKIIPYRYVYGPVSQVIPASGPITLTNNTTAHDLGRSLTYQQLTTERGYETSVPRTSKALWVKRVDVFPPCAQSPS